MFNSEIRYYDNRKSKLKGLGEHFKFKVHGKSIIYCYIRKNACSAFKDLIYGVSENHNQITKYKNRLDFLYKNHFINKPSKFLDSDHSIFVYRDPVERAISLYLSKFVYRQGNSDIFSNYYDITSCDPEKATFRKFVFNYLNKLSNKIDPHCYTQYSHLKPYLYSDAILLEELYEKMSLLIGETLSKKYFKQKVNASYVNSESGITTQLYGDVPSEELFIQFQKEGKEMIPSKKAFIDDTIEKKICDIYQEDIDMIKRINQKLIGSL